MHNLRIGQLVTSVAGRDAGKHYLVIGTDSDKYVWVVDGKYRKMEKPKRKNSKHLLGRKSVAEELAKKLHVGEKITNFQVRKVLSDLIAEVEYGHLPDQE